MERSLISDSCPFCKCPVFADEGYYSNTGAHSRCQPKMEDIFSAMDAALSEFGFKSSKPRARVGDGKTATKLKERIVAMIEAHYGMKVVSANIWGQQGAYRGVRWDLDSWGVDLELENKIKVAVHSLGKMTESLRDKNLVLRKNDDIPHSFEAC